MQITATAATTSLRPASLSVIGKSIEASAVAGSLAAAGHQVRLCGQADARVERIDIIGLDRPGQAESKSVKLAGASANAEAMIKGAEVLIVADGATEYGAIVGEIHGFLNSGQTIFLHNAPFAGSFEFEWLLRQKRKDLAVNIIEMGPLFAAVMPDRSIPGKLTISAPAARPLISGRTINETRTALSLGGAVWNGLVPASNLLERAFSRKVVWLDAARLLFDMLLQQESQVQQVLNGLGRAAGAAPSRVETILKAMNDEIDSLGRELRVAVNARQSGLNCRAASGGEGLACLQRLISEEFVILSELARLVRAGVPVIDSVIELASVITGSAIRKNGRRLESLGFIGMDAGEIREAMSA